MSPYSVLQEPPHRPGSPRRRRRVWPWVAFAGLLIGAAVAVPTVLDHATDEGGAPQSAVHRGTGGGDDAGLNGQPSVSTGPRVSPVLAAYARHRVAPDERVSMRFKVQPTAGLLFDVRTGRVLWQRHPHKVLSIASLTKMMTALLVARSEPADAKVRVTRQALAYKGSGIGLLPKHKSVQLETLLYGLMLPSGNDAAIALAQKVAHGSVRTFVRRMNRQAREYGLDCTRYSGPDGFDDRGNKSCARDLAVIARQVLRNRRLRKIVATPKAVRPFPVKGHRIWLYNNNTLMRRRYPGVTGVKTGFTNKAGHCLVATAKHGNVELGIVLLHSPDTAQQGAKLLNAGFHKVGA